MRPSRWSLVAAGLLMAIEVPLSTLVPLIARRLFDVALPEQDLRHGLGLCGLIVLITLTTQIVGAGYSVILARFHMRFGFRLRLKLFRQLQLQSAAYYSDKDTGNLMARQVADVNSVEGLLADSFIRAGVDAVRAVVFVVILWVLDPWVAATAFAVIVLMFLMNWRLSRPLRRFSSITRQVWEDTSGTLHESLAGHALIRASAAERRARKRFASRLSSYLRENFRRDMTGMLAGRLTGIGNGIGLAATLMAGSWRILEGEFTIGGLFAFFLYLSLFFAAAQALANLNPRIQKALVAGERIVDLLDTEPDVRDRPGAREREIQEGRVAFHGVSFSYREDLPVLRDVDLEVEPGETVALVGPSGAGKTTLVGLVPRLHDPDEGTITIDGWDITTCRLRSLRRQVSMVSQDIFLLNRSIRENLTFGVDGERRLSEESIVEAAKTANAHQFIEELRHGYDTVVGERGVQLSGGQKQRLAIARELLRKPRILILDEATSHLDTESERLVHDALDRLRRERTTFVVAHRLSTVLGADQILVLDEGRIVARGSHSDLLGSSPLYRRLYENQFRDSDPGSPEAEEGAVPGQAVKG